MHGLSRAGGVVLGASRQSFVAGAPHITLLEKKGKRGEKALGEDGTEK
jgi:hypothetical protein